MNWFPQIPFPNDLFIHKDDGNADVIQRPPPPPPPPPPPGSPPPPRKGDQTEPEGDQTEPNRPPKWKKTARCTGRGGRGGRRRKDAKPSTKTVASSMVIPKWTKAARKGVNPSTKEPRVLTKGKGKGVHPSPTVKALPMKKHKEMNVSSDMDVAWRSRRQLKRQRPSPATVRKRIQALREVTVTVAVRRHR